MLCDIRQEKGRAWQSGLLPDVCHCLPQAYIWSGDNGGQKGSVTVFQREFEISSREVISIKLQLSIQLQSQSIAAGTKIRRH